MDGQFNFFLSFSPNKTTSFCFDSVNGYSIACNRTPDTQLRADKTRCKHCPYSVSQIESGFGLFGISRGLWGWRELRIWFVRRKRRYVLVSENIDRVYLWFLQYKQRVKNEFLPLASYTNH